MGEVEISTALDIFFSSIKNSSSGIPIFET